ncbi:LysR family transcriptional regulator [Chelatococcus reniformis]|uniref:LysR family transcriptional regulator n=1 Tax=Chelatococcus reniformis TaxID=1494448 RepID=A0A916UKN1_9HYPH|nr:LysR family transcriptional regulator [Chelatococcus reniformis]GGC76660.1 LysR family transcriptional regulator [Chelatococcus reniformis]
MDFRRVRYFVHVADLRNMTRAAAVLGISQPALSRQMQLLEAELGTKLFHRHGHGVVLTANGALFLDRCAHLLNQFEDVRSLFQNRPGRSQITGAVGIGMPVPVIRMFADPFVARFSEAYPGISLRMAEGFSALLHEWLLSGSMDLAMLYGVRPSKVLIQEKLLAEDLFLMSAPDEPFARPHGRTYLREIGETPMILPHRPHVLRDLVDQCGMEPSSVIEVDALTLMVELASAGKGVTLLPIHAVDHLARGKIAATPLADKGMSWDVTLCYSSLRPLSEAAQETYRAVRAEVHRLVEDGRWIARLAAAGSTI